MLGEILVCDKSPRHLTVAKKHYNPMTQSVITKNCAKKYVQIFSFVSSLIVFCIVGTLATFINLAIQKTPLHVISVIVELLGWYSVVVMYVLLDIAPGLVGIPWISTRAGRIQYYHDSWPVW